MDPDVFPNSLEYWGPTGMVFFRNVQVRWMPIKGDTQPDAGARAAGRQRRPGRARRPHRAAEHQGPLPAARLHRRVHATAASGATSASPACCGEINWDDVLDDQFDLSGSATGWGLNFSSNLKPATSDVIRLQFVFGEGIQNYMNDSPVDIGIADNSRQPGHADPRQADARSSASWLFLDHTWNDKWSQHGRLLADQDNDNTDGQAPDAFKTGHYALGNLLYTPVPNVMMGGEFQWGRRENFSDGFTSRRRQGAVLVQVQLLAQARRLVDEPDTHSHRRVAASSRWRWCSRARRSGPGARPTSRRPSTPPTRSTRTCKEGKNADYIPALAKVDPNLFGIAVVTADGKVYTAGDLKTEVSIQSISKVFTMAQVIQEQGLESIAKRIGVDATGARFNSIIAVEGVKTVVGAGAPEMNPLVNPGAISATSMVKGATADEVWKKIIGIHNDFGRAAADACCRTSTSPSPTPTSATRRSAR